MSDCGCHDRGESQRVLCAIHWSAFHLRAYQHGEPHDDCCDASLLSGEIRDSGRSVVESAIETMPKTDRDYWRGLLARGE